MSKLLYVARTLSSSRPAVNARSSFSCEKSAVRAARGRRAPARLGRPCVGS